MVFNLKWLELVERKPEGAGAIPQRVIIAGERYRLSLLSQEFHRGQMESIERPHWLWERLQRPREDRGGKLDERNAAQQGTNLIRMRCGQFTRVNPGPDFILKEAAGNQILLPKPVGWRPVFGKQLSEGNRSIEIDHRSLRSRSSSRRNSRKDMTGLRGGGPDGGRAGGVIQPWRTASASKASAKTGVRFFSGGTISATTRSRSVTKTVSPCAARRTYSLSLFFRTFKPTDLMEAM